MEVARAKRTPEASLALLAVTFGCAAATAPPVLGVSADSLGGEQLSDAGAEDVES